MSKNIEPTLSVTARNYRVVTVGEMLIGRYNERAEVVAIENRKIIMVNQEGNQRDLDVDTFLDEYY